MEEVIDVIRGVSGHTYDMLYDLFFTNDRLAVINIQNPDDVSLSVSPWLFIFGGWMEKNRENQKRRRIIESHRLQEKTAALEELLAGRPQNYALAYADISSVRITNSFFQYKLKFQMNNPLSRPRVLTFTLKSSQVEQTRAIIQNVMPSKIKP